MGLKFFGKSDPTPALLGTAMVALIGNESASAEQIDAANQELETSGLKGAQLVPTGTLEELEGKAGRLDAAEARVKATTTALTAAGATDVATLAADRDSWKQKAETYGDQPGELGTTSTKTKADVSEGGGDEHQKAIDELPHNKALAGHPVFG